MRKIFSFFVAVMAVAALNASVETWKCSDYQLANAQSFNDSTITVGDVSFVFSKGGNKTAPAYYTSGAALRVYGSNTMAITSKENLNNVVFTFAAAGNVGGFKPSVGEYSVDATTGLWTGNASELSFVNEGTTQARILSIAFYTGADVYTPGEKWVPDTIGVTAARKLIDEKDIKSHYVKGIVSVEPYINYGTGCIWIRDIENEKDTLEGFKIDEKVGVPFTAETLAETVVLGDTVLLYADGLSLFEDKNHNFIYETTSGYLAEVKGSSAVTRLDITQGAARYDAEDSELELSLTTEKGEFVITILDYYNAKAIVGEYSFNEETDVKLAGEALTLTSGKMTIAYKEGYTVNVTLNTADKVYILKGVGLILGEFPDDKPYEPEPLPEGVITCTEAQAIGLALEAGAKTEVEYTVRGWVTGVLDFKKEGQESCWVGDERGGKGLIEAYYCYCSMAVEKGDYVEIKGNILKYHKDTTKDPIIEISNGQMTIMNRQAEGFLNTADSVKAVKRVINGQLFIERAGVLYTITGAAL